MDCVCLCANSLDYWARMWIFIVETLNKLRYLRTYLLYIFLWCRTLTWKVHVSFIRDFPRMTTRIKCSWGFFCFCFFIWLFNGCILCACAIGTVLAIKKCVCSCSFSYPMWCKVELCLRNGNLNLDKSDVVLQWTDRGTHEN